MPWAVILHAIHLISNPIAEKFKRRCRPVQLTEEEPATYMTTLHMDIFQILPIPTAWLGSTWNYTPHGHISDSPHYRLHGLGLPGRNEVSPSFLGSLET